MDEKTIQITPFTGEKEKWHMWSVKLMKISRIKGYHILLPGSKKILTDDSDATEEKEVYALK